MKYPALKYLALISMVGVSSMSYAQKCAPVAKELYQDLNVASVINKPEVTTELLTKNCFDLEVYKKTDGMVPVFFSKNIENVLLYERAKVDLLSLREPATDIDLISYFLLNPRYVFPVGPQEKELVVKWGQKYKTPVDVNDFNFTVAPVERKKIINYLASKYKSVTNNSKDKLGNSNLTYAVQAGEYAAIKPLLGLSGSTQGMYKKNNNGLAPVHMVFFMDYMVDEDKKLAMERTNDAVLETLSTGRLLYAKYEKMSFFDFAELMKDKNPDFYDKLKRKFFFKSTIKAQNMAEYRASLIETADSLKKLKALSAERK